jgi:hypothetical protein
MRFGQSEQHQDIPKQIIVRFRYKSIAYISACLSICLFKEWRDVRIDALMSASKGPSLKPT